MLTKKHKNVQTLHGRMRHHRMKTPLAQNLSGPNRTMQPRCAMRFEAHIPKSLAMRKIFLFASDAKTHSLDLKSQENAARKRACENPAMLACDAKNRVDLLRSSDAKCLRFGLPLRFGLRCEQPRCQITSDVGRVMRTT